MFGVKIITGRSLESLKSELKTELLGDFKSVFSEFTNDVVECINNNLQGFSQTLEGMPCKTNGKSIEELKHKYLKHDKQIAEHEKRITVLEKKMTN